MLLLRDMWADRLQATVVTLNGVIQACQKCSRWKETLLLLDEMCCSKIDPNLVTFNGVLAACSQSRA
jgi:pentatricopeptide repeat protein